MGTDWKNQSFGWLHQGSCHLHLPWWPSLSANVELVTLAVYLASSEVWSIIAFHISWQIFSKLVCRLSSAYIPDTLFILAWKLTMSEQNKSYHMEYTQGTCEARGKSMLCTTIPWSSLSRRSLVILHVEWHPSACPRGAAGSCHHRLSHENQHSWEVSYSWFFPLCCQRQAAPRQTFYAPNKYLLNACKRSNTLCLKSTSTTCAVLRGRDICSDGLLSRALLWPAITTLKSDLYPRLPSASSCTRAGFPSLLFIGRC